MKKIYTFTVEGEDYYSEEFKSNLRLMTYMLYETVKDYEECDTPLNSNEDITYNEIHEDVYTKEYFLDSDIYNCNYFIDYEPFIIGYNSFGFTIDDKFINEESIVETLDYVKNLLKLDYSVKIDSESYQSGNTEERNNRWNAIKLVFEKLGCKINKKAGFLKKLVKPTYNKRRRCNI